MNRHFISRTVMSLKQVTPVNQCCCYHLTSSCTSAKNLKSSRGMKWRISKGESRTGFEYGPLTDLPDFSYLDGRPTPLTPSQQRRRSQRIELAKDIMTKLHQIDFAKQRFEDDQKAKQQEIKSILDNKLKAKNKPL